MTRIENDKYYTPKDLAKYCIDTVFDVLAHENIVEIVEPSAGNGSFSNQIKGCIAYDIDPERDSIIKQDYLKLDTEYLSGRLVIGNPPFGSRMSLAQRFFKKSVTIADYIAFILPISQLNNTSSLYEFDLVHSEDLGKQTYTDRELHCCFNIYKRPVKGLNRRTHNRLKDITIVRQDSKRFEEVTDHTIRMCYWGDGSAGKILEEDEAYAAEYKIIIHNKELEDEIVKTLHGIDWHSELNKIAMLKIQQFHIHDVLRKYVEGIK